MYNTFYKLPTFPNMGIKETPHHFCDQEDEELERGTCGDDRRSSCANTDIKSRTPPILATDSACWYSSTSATASLYTACSSQTKTSPSIKKGKTLIDTIIWNIRNNISLTLLQIKGYTTNLASHKGREKNNIRNVRVGKHTTPSKYRNLSLAISSRAFTPKNKNTHKTFNAHKKNKNKKTREEGVKRKKHSTPRSDSSIKQKQRNWHDGWKEVST
jgi:hypothetical protein